MPDEDQSVHSRQWALLHEYYVQGAPIMAMVIDIAADHLLVDIGGVRGTFAWQHQEPGHSTGYSTVVDPPHVMRTLKRGERIEVVVKEIDTQRHHLVLGRYLLSEQAASASHLRQLELMIALQPGDVYTATVRALEGRRAILAVEGVEGHLLHNYEMALLIGQNLAVMVLEKTSREIVFVLDRPALRLHTWQELAVGRIISGVIRVFVEQGMYVDIGGMLAFVPSAYAVSGYLTSPMDLFHREQHVYIQILTIEQPYRVVAKVIVE